MWEVEMTRGWHEVVPCLLFGIQQAWVRTPTANVQLRLGLEHTVFQLSSHIWSYDLMKPRFLMSHCRKNSVRDKVIGKKWIYLERNTLQRESVGHLRRWEALKYGWFIFMGWVTSKANEQEDYINYFGNGMGISRNWATTYFLTFDGQPQNCHGASGCVTYFRLMYYQCIMRPSSAINAKKWGKQQNGKD